MGEADVTRKALFSTVLPGLRNWLDGTSMSKTPDGPMVKGWFSAPSLLAIVPVTPLAPKIKRWPAADEWLLGWPTTMKSAHAAVQINAPARVAVQILAVF